ncbi:MAG: hypothetical protein CBD02_00410 [Candidatus Pelagibacter sp. TMED142]|nr:MAG: hypothetical protein CBD02_00410 [Candidatus Pelagibacter sp. TMED142]
MNKKILIQIGLFSIIILILIIIFSIYTNYNKKNVNFINDKRETLNKSEEIKTNIIKNIEYFSQDEKNNTYKINSEYGKIDPNKPNLILMENVFAEIILSDSEPISIYSDFALYDNINYDTNFYENVKLTHVFHKITSEKIDLAFKDNLVFISDNVIYKNLNSKLIADEVRIDLLTKDIKIFMNKKNKKIRIENKK